MNSDVRIVAVDIGNTAVKVALESDLSLEIGKFDPTQNDWQRDTIDWVHRRLNRNDPSIEWRIATVKQSTANRLRVAIDDSNPVASIHSITASDVPIEIGIDAPERVGVDRLLSSYAAWSRFNGPVVVVDAGSAVTVDWVDKGRFCGGTIFPGLQLQANSLDTGTAALPRIELGIHESIPLPGRNTREAIVAGIILGTASSIDGLTRRYAEVFDVSTKDFVVVLTGGDAPTLSPHLQTSHELIPELVCDGLLRLSGR